ncbi:alpha/beta hydrolase family protein [Bradyrhizobium sp. CCBAU 65884]|uniref:alpha/beta hydrolase family protein n=1 Tax=Bradyrhizobium sp. CCBAU 65884 TaxID=722477 RepID=UPI0023058C07|nr:dienelactone hydrolase [Bradyrhizobium sp. CCBAU 65884]
MHRTLWAFAVILCCLASPARAAGIQLLQSDPALSGAIWYPCAAEPTHVALGGLSVGADFDLKGVKDCPVTGAKLPLVVFSHGRGGWFGANHDTEEALADAGFIVAAINHPGDTTNDSSRRDTLPVWGSRPADMVRLLDFMLKDWKDRAVIDPAKVGFFGFSLGGYTGLALMGTKPDFSWLAENCKETTGTCGQLHNGETLPDPPQDARIRTAVIVDPAPAVLTRKNRRDQTPFPIMAIAVRRSRRGRRFARGACCGVVGGQARDACGSCGPLRLPRTVHAGAGGGRATHLHRCAGGLRPGRLSPRVQCVGGEVLP